MNLEVDRIYTNGKRYRKLLASFDDNAWVYRKVYRMGDGGWVGEPFTRTVNKSTFLKWAKEVVKS